MKVLCRLRAMLMLLAVLGVCLSACSGSSDPVADTATERQAEEALQEMEIPQVVPVLVNSWHPIHNDYSVGVRELPNGHRVAAECYTPLTEMLAACAAAGYSAEVCSGYRSIADQQALYEHKVDRVMEEGHLREDAERIAAMEVAYPGTSEHHTGLAVDIIDKDYPVLDETQEQQPAQQWLLENSWRYGFVLRYPTGKTHVTGIIYEPWHYRYVGEEIARLMYEQAICLEEYLELYG